MTDKLKGTTAVESNEKIQTLRSNHLEGMKDTRYNASTKCIRNTENDNKHAVQQECAFI
jgi:hypothetical protein